MSDLFKTQLQETGRASTLGLPLSEVLADIEELGIDPALCILGAGTVVAFEAVYVPCDARQARMGSLIETDAGRNFFVIEPVEFIRLRLEGDSYFEVTFATGSGSGWINPRRVLAVYERELSTPKAAAKS